MSRSIKCKVSSSYGVQCGIISIDDISKMLSHFERLAKNLAREVKNTKQEIVMENMNSYERRIVHNCLTNMKGITTISEGEEPNRHVIIKPTED